MNSRQRVMNAFENREADRVPVDLSGHRSSGISAIAYQNLREHLGLPPKPIRVYDLVQQLAIVDGDVLDRFHVDTVELGRAFALEDSAWREWTLPGGSPCLVPSFTNPVRENGGWALRSEDGTLLARMPEGCLYFEQVHYPYYEGEPDLDRLDDALDHCMWTAVASPPGPLANREQLAAGAKRLRETTDRAIIGLFGGNLLEIGQFLFRNDKFLMMLGMDPKTVHRFLDKLVERHLKNLEDFLGAVGEHIDIILFGDDLGMQSGPQMSPAMYREFFKPRHQAMWKRVKELADVKIMLHCCGGVRPLLPELIDAGLEAINPVQISCAGMDPARLKADFGRDIVLWGGGCDTQTVLPLAAPDEVRRHVRENTAILRQNGGFVFQQVHNILANVPPENIVAMFDAVNEESPAAV